MANIKLKDSVLKNKIAYGKSAKPLGERSEDEIKDLAILALSSNSKSLLNLFESLPTLDELKKEKTDFLLNRIPQTLEVQKEETSISGTVQSANKRKYN